MDGSEVTVVVLGQKGVGKTTFIEHCFLDVPGTAQLSRHTKVLICGREIKINIVDSPKRQQLVPAIMVIMLFDLTQHDSFKYLQHLLEVAQHVSPAALKAVVGTKADLEDTRQVQTQEALDFCHKFSGNMVPIPYYETSTKFPNSILLAFQEIMARPLINDYVIKTTTEQEQSIFVHEVMEWAISNNSANILTHLRDLGYPIPLDIIERHSHIIRDYLLGEYPLREVPRFQHIVLKDVRELLSWEDSSLLDDGEETVLTIQDTRPTIKVIRTYHLLWRDISLALFPSSFLHPSALDVFHITHIDLSYNKLTSLLPDFFRMPLLESLDVSHNHLTALPAIELWKFDSRLQLLKVSHNLLTGEGQSPVRTSQSRRGQHRALWYMDLSHNQLCAFPQYLLHFPLRYLDISHNGKITTIPSELSKMEQLATLLLHGLSLTDPPHFVVKDGPQAILHYLKLKLTNKMPWSSLRVVIVGPHHSGKSSLISKITGSTISQNKALDVVEWKYRGSEIFSFRSRWLTFDLWDFSGDPELQSIYPCFNCHTSLHLVVCDAHRGVHDLVRWLADLQSLSEERVVVMVVFTHMDKLRPREEREKFRKTCFQWLHYHNEQGGNGSFSLMATTSVRSLQGEEMLTSYEADVPQEAFDIQEMKGPDIPLMPLVLGIHFVSNTSGEGIQNLKKTLYKMGCGSFSSQLTSQSRSTLINRDVPYIYSQIENLMRQLRVIHRDNREGQQQVFYTPEELRERLKNPLLQLKATELDFKAALKFIHEMGLVHLHHPSAIETLVCLDPQLIGCLLQRTMHACKMSQDTNPGCIFLADTHLSMMWGVEPILSMEDKDSHNDKSPPVTSAQLLHFLKQLKVFAPLLPGVTLLAPILPPALPRTCDPDSTSLTPRRAYIFSYLPSFLHTHLISRLVAAIVRDTDPESSPSSPNQPSPPASIPITLPSGLKLYLWQRNLFMCVPEEETRVWVRVREGDVGLDPLPNCGRIDIHLAGRTLQKEAHWLRLLTREIDKLLNEDYPGLLDSARPQKVEIFVPLSQKVTTTAEVEESGSEFEDSREFNTTTQAPFTLSQTDHIRSSSGSPPHRSSDRELDNLPPLNESVNSATNLVSPISQVHSPLHVDSRDRTLSNIASPSDQAHNLQHQKSGSGSSPSDQVYNLQHQNSENGSNVASPSDRVNSPHHRNNGTRSTVVSPSDQVFSPRRRSSGNGTLSNVVLPSEATRRRGSGNGTSSMRVFPLGKPPSNSSGLSTATPLNITPPLSVTPKLSDHSWEVLSKYSTTSSRLSIQQDQSDPHYNLVPLWECLQEAFKTPVIRVDHNRLTLSQVIPDLLFADLSPKMLFRTKVSSPDRYLMSLEDHFFGGMAPPPPEATGMFVQSYYSFDHDDIFVRKPAGALKAFYLESCLTELRKDLVTLQQLETPHLVAVVGVQYCPPSLALEAAPFGSLRSWMRRLRRKMRRVDTHYIALQLLNALDFFHGQRSSYHSIDSDKVLVWNLDPLVVKLSHSGITHSSKDCQLCIYMDSLPSDHSAHKSFRFDYMLLGLLVYEMATGKRPFEEIYPLTTLVLALLNRKVELNIEADYFLQKQGQEDSEDCFATGCQRLCLQSSIDQCLFSDPVKHRELEARFSLCAGDHFWSPMRLLVNVEAIICSHEDSDLVYWASGSRGLVTGTMTLSDGKLTSDMLQEAPPPESGMFANRRSKPVPIAVGRATGLALVQETKQLWVGTENGQMGSVYVFNLPDMRRHHHIHLQDAVLSLCAINRLADRLGGEDMHYRVLVGLANGTIILFLGLHAGKVLDNPLQGPKLVISTYQRKPCLTMTLASGCIWCSCGDTMEVYDICSLKLLRRLSTFQAGGGGSGTSRGDVITLMSISGKGVWTVGRRSSVLRLWDQKTGEFRASYDIFDVIQDVDGDITALAVQGGAVWLGTRNGYIFILDSYLMQERQDPLLGLQHCDQGKVKCIVPLKPSSAASSKLQVICSLEFADEVSCLLLAWEYLSATNRKGSNPLGHTPRISATMPDLVVSSHTHSELQHCKSF